MVGHICLVDGSNLLHRADSVAAPKLRPSDGQNIGSVSIFCAMVLKLLKRMREGKALITHSVMFFDPSREESWRRKIYPEYKADRSPMAADLVFQIEMMKEFLGAIGFAYDTAPHHEADDLIGAYTEDCVKKGMRVSIVSRDKDLMQLIRPGVLQLDDVSKKWFNEEAVFEKFGVCPDRLGDYLALVGDRIDGIKGAKGIGAKAACELLNEFDSLDVLFENIDKLKKPSWRKTFAADKESILFCRELVALDVGGAPRNLTLNDMRFPDEGCFERAENWKRDNLR